MGQIKAVGQASHRLKAYHVARLRRVDDRDRKFRAKADRHSSAVRFEPELAVGVHAAEHVVQLAAGERRRIGQIHRLGFSSGNHFVRKRVVLAHRHVNLPSIARSHRESDTRDGNRSPAASGPSSDSRLWCGLRESPPDSRCVISMECAKGNCAIHSGCFQNSSRLVTWAACASASAPPLAKPKRRATGRESAGHRDRAGFRRRRGFSQVALSVGPICIAIQTIGPRRKKRDAGLRLFLLPFGKRRRRHENWLAVDAHIVGDVADGWANRNFDAVRGVAETNRFEGIDR